MGHLTARVAVLMLFTSLLGCSSVTVKRLDPAKPDGVPFYLTKQMKQTITTTWALLQLPATGSPVKVATYKVVDVSVIEVLDTQQAYTLNKTKPLFGESKFSFERPTASSTSTIAKASVEDKEGLVEFLKGLVEGAKTLAEVAREGAKAAAGAPAALFDQNEASITKDLLAKGYLLIKESVTVDLSDLTPAPKAAP